MVAIPTGYMAERGEVISFCYLMLVILPDFDYQYNSKEWNVGILSCPRAKRGGRGIENGHSCKQHSTRVKVTPIRGAATP